MERVMQEVSDDTRLVIRSIVESPVELSYFTRVKRPEQARRLIWKRLREIGWTMGRVANCFDEVREVLAAD